MNDKLTFLEKAKNEVKKNEIRENTIKKIEILVRVIKNNKLARNYISEANDKNDIFWGFDSSNNYISEIINDIHIDLFKLDIIINNNNLISFLHRIKFEYVDDLFKNLKAIKILLIDCLYRQTEIYDFLNALDVLYNGQIISESDFEEIIQNINKMSLLSENHILILKETKKENSFVILNRINKKHFSINKFPKSIIIPSEENLNFVKKLEKEIEDKYF
jgi:hypothetical protein